MFVGMISMVNLSIADAFIYVNHTNPHSALHIPPMQPIVRSNLSKYGQSPLPSGHFPKFHSVHILRSRDSFTFANMFGTSNILVVEFDGIFYKYNIPICINKHPIMQPMIMGMHPQYISLSTKYGDNVWKANNLHLSHRIKIFG